MNSNPCFVVNDPSKPNRVVIVFLFALLSREYRDILPLMLANEENVNCFWLNLSVTPPFGVKTLVLLFLKPLIPP